MPYRAEECDVRSARLPELLAEFTPHVVVHPAAQVDVVDSMRSPALNADVNVCSTIAVAEGAATAGASMEASA